MTTNPNGNVYFVSPNGDDTYDGKSVQSPFRTIQKAAEWMKAGDTCYIRGGTYRETVIPCASGTESAPIRFEAYNGEQVIVDGCDLITRWTHHKGCIYKGDMDWNIGEGNGNIVFVNGELCREAVWPNISDRLNRSQYAAVGTSSSAGSTSSIFDEDLLAFPDGYWNGAMVACVSGVGYFISTAPVTDFRAGTLHFDQWVSSMPWHQAEPGNPYFITRTLNALDSEMEWYYDNEEHKLYLWAPGGDHPDKHEVEAKKREYAFDLRGRAYIEIIGIEVRAASITTENANHCLISRARICGIDRYFGPRQSIYGRTKGIELGGSFNTIRESEIYQFEGIGLNVSGTRNSVINCFIHDGNFEATYASLVWITGSEHLVSHCTITRAARTCVSGVFERSVIQYCDISHANCLTKDSGVIYLFNSDFDNTEIHHNWLHDNESPHLSFGFYMDAWTSGVQFYRNVVWNIPHRGLLLNRPNQRTLVYNNTFYRSGDAESALFFFDEMYGCQAVNNIFADGSIVEWGEDCYLSHNLTGADAKFVDPERSDFRLRSDSPAIGAGRNIDGVTGRIAGGAPDMGAYQSDGEHWLPGHDFGKQPDVELRLAELECRSRLTNGGFERGVWNPWSVTRGEPRIVFGCAWDYSWNGYPSVVRSNKYAAMLGEGDKIEQTVSRLKPNTTYMVWAGVKSEGCYRNAEEYDRFQADESWDLAPDGGHAIYRDVRYVGPLKAGDWLMYRNIDFGTGGKYDSFAAGLTGIVAPSVIEVRLDSPDGELLGLISLMTDYTKLWRYFSIPIREAKGVRDLYLVISGEGRCLIDNFKLYHSFLGARVKISVHADSGEKASRTISKISWEAKTEKLAFTTAADETEVTVSFENLGGQYACIDDCGLWKPDLQESDRM